MERIFISSLARGEMSDIRKGARTAVESLGMHPVMFETEGASDQGSRRALLGRIPTCDACLLLLGGEYGEPGERGLSPTEEEFEEAVRSGLPILALVQEGVEREPRQQEFIARVRGTWEEGHFAPTFTDHSDVVAAVVRALNGWRNRAPDAARREAAAGRVQGLAAGSDRRGMTPGGSKLRTIAVPLLSRPLLDAVALTDGQTVDALIAAARGSGLVSQSAGVQARIDADDVHLVYEPGRGFDQFEVIVGADGAVMTEGPVGGGDTSPGSLGWMVVMHDRIPEVIARGLAFTEEAWRTIDTRGEIDQVFVGAAIANANSKTYSFHEPGGRVSTSMHGLPELLVVPDAPLLLRRQDLLRPENATRLQAEVRHRFETAGAVNSR